MTNQPEFMQPVAPPDIANPQPVGGAVAPVMPEAADTIHSAYEVALDSGDPKSMFSLAQRAQGTPYERVIRGSAEKMQEYSAEVEDAAKPIIEAGGINTPKGRIEAGKAAEFLQDKPQYGRAFVEMLLGNPKWRVFATGGTPTVQIGYDKNGRQIERTVNEFGKPISAVDAETGQKLNRQQLAERGGFLPSLENAIGFQQQKAIAGFNAEAYNKANQATNEYAAKAPELKQIYSEMRQRLQNLAGSELTADQRAALGAFSSRVMGFSQTMSDGFNALRQKVDNKNANLSRSEQSAINSVLGKLGWKFGADGSVTKGTGEAVTKTDLDQAQNTLNNSNEFSRQFTQSKDDFIRSEVFKGLSAAEMKNLGRILDLQGMAEKSIMELSSKHGTLPFLINPKTYQIGDEFSRGEALSLIGEFNQDATEAYNKWRERQLQTYKRNNTVPNAGELESAFAQTEEYKRLRADYAERNKEILRRPAVTRPETERPADQWNLDLGLGVAPAAKPASIKERIKERAPQSEGPPSYKLVGKSSDGKNVYENASGKRFVEK